MAATKSSARKTQSTRRQDAQSTKAESTSPVSSEQPVAEQPKIKSLSSAWHLLTRSTKLLTDHLQFWLIFSGVFALLNLLLVHNFSTDVGALKSDLSGFLGVQTAATGLSTYALLIAENSSAPGAAAAFQYALMVIGSLAAIWALRQFMSDKGSDTVRVRDSLYRGMYPLIPFILILVLLSIELIPLLVVGSLYSIAVSGGVTRTIFEQGMFLALFLAGAVLSAWLVVRTVFALYIVTLADMQPVEALRDAVRIVKGRQLGIIRRLVFLLLILMVVSTAILLPIILFLTPLTQLVFFALSIFALPFIHAYMYSLYRELLG